MKARKTNIRTKINGSHSKLHEQGVGSKTVGKWEKHGAKPERINARLGNDNPKRNARIAKKLAKRNAK